MGGGCGHILETDSEQAKAAPAGGTLRRCQEWSLPIAVGPPPAAAAADALGQVGPVVLMPPLCPGRLLLPCFLASEEPPGWEEGQEQGKAPV